MSPPTRISPKDAAARPLPPGRLSSVMFDADGIEIRYYAPRKTDPQTPHDRDEFYFVISGTGTFERVVRGQNHGSDPKTATAFENNAEKIAFGPGDMLFAAAGDTHRFSGFSADFATWVLFYGPKKV